MNKLNKRGFTLVELVIVIAVIAILAAVLIPTFSGAIQKANESAVLQAARSAYEEVLTLDLSDGKLDEKDNGTPISLSNVEFSANAQKTDYDLFVYTDSAKSLKATYNGSVWNVESTATN